MRRERRAGGAEESSSPAATVTRCGSAQWRGVCASAHVLASIAARGRLGLGACSKAGRQRRSTEGRWGSAHKARPWRGDRAPAAARQNGHCTCVTGGGCGVRGKDSDAEKTGRVGGYVNKLEQLRQLVGTQHFLRVVVSVYRVQHDVQHTRVTCPS
jgi:hypothetical protein